MAGHRRGISSNEVRIMRSMTGFRCDAAGATAVEYAFLLSLIALVIIGSVRLVGEVTGDRICSPIDGLADAGVESIDAECP